MITGRFVLAGGVIGGAAAINARWLAAVSHAAEGFEVTHSDAEWQKLLTPAQAAQL